MGYEGRAGAAVFPSERACLEPLLAGLPRPWAEIGTGSGRFAAALGVDVGLDPAAALLAEACRVTRSDASRWAPGPAAGAPR
jgi:hypothetical protein